MLTGNGAVGQPRQHIDGLNSELPNSIPVEAGLILYDAKSS